MEPALRLVVGLGNPGEAYRATRHNAGFWFVDRLAQQHASALRTESRFFGATARLRHPHGECWLLEPGTFMNRSGRSVGALVHYYQLLPAQVLVVHDELDLEPGVVRLKKGGGSAGHNGLKDITAVLGTPDYWRLRIGVGRPGPARDLAGYVLDRPAAAEQEAIEGALTRALEVSALLLAGQLAQATQQLHTVVRPNPPRPPA